MLRWCLSPRRKTRAHHDDQQTPQRKWPREGPFSVEAFASVTMLLDDHDLVVMTMPAAVTMPIAAHFSARTIAVVITAALDHNGLRACNRRRRNGDRAQGG